MDPALLPPATALIAEDEPLLAQALQAELAACWPALRILAVAGDGDTALRQALALRPELLFLDIRMPGASGLEVAQALAEDWPAGTPLPLVVFVTAYDRYALEAFDAAAADYLLKPVEPQRLARSCERLGRQLGQRRLAAPAAATDAPSAAAAASGGATHPREPRETRETQDTREGRGTEAGGPGREAGDLEPLLAQLRRLLAVPGLAAPPGGRAAGSAAPAEPEPLSLLPCSVGSAGEVRMVPLAEVVMLEAADKYVRVLTSRQEYLIRSSLRELLPRLDARRFWQVHRGTVVRVDAVQAAVREPSGRLRLQLQGCSERPVVSRLYAHLFRPL